MGYQLKRIHKFAITNYNLKLMKKTIFYVATLIVAISAGVSFHNYGNSEKALSELQLKNIEALSQTENPNISYGYKVTDCITQTEHFGRQVTGARCDISYNRNDICYHSHCWGKCD